MGCELEVYKVSEDDVGVCENKVAWKYLSGKLLYNRNDNCKLDFALPRRSPTFLIDYAHVFSVLVYANR